MFEIFIEYFYFLGKIFTFIQMKLSLVQSPDIIFDDEKLKNNDNSNNNCLVGEARLR